MSASKARLRAVLTMLAAAAIAMATAAPASAHEEREVGAVAMVVGWADEPAIASFKNAVQLFLNDASGDPVTDAAETLQVEVTFEGESVGPLPLDPAFGPGFGTPGEYQVPMIPTRPGTYEFHFTGEAGGEQIDEVFTSSETTFDSPSDPAQFQFPAKDPSTAELAQAVEQLQDQQDDGGSDAAPLIVSVVALLVAGAALVVSLRGGRPVPR
jgi:hypothetical protein